MRIGVLVNSQTPESTPEHFVSKSLAHQFLSHYHNGKKAVIRLSDRTIWIKADIAFSKLKALFRAENLAAKHKPVVANYYIPDKMPPLNVPGVWFQEPQSATWREAHRSVVFFSA